MKEKAEQINIVVSSFTRRCCSEGGLSKNMHYSSPKIDLKSATGKLCSYACHSDEGGIYTLQGQYDTDVLHTSKMYQIYQKAGRKNTRISSPKIGLKTNTGRVFNFQGCYGFGAVTPRPMLLFSPTSLAQGRQQGKQIEQWRNIVLLPENRP